MKIAINLLSIPNQLTGVGNYAKNLVKHLSIIDRDNEYYVFIKKEMLKHFRVENNNFKFVVVPVSSAISVVLLEQFVLPLYMLFLKINVLHSPHYSTSLIGWWFKRIVTFPDLTFFLFQEKHEKHKVIYFRAMMRMSALMADKIISISDSTKQDIIKLLAISNDRIATTKLAISSEYYDEIVKENYEDVFKLYSIPPKYILFVGTIEPRKNVFSIIKAYLSMDSSIREAYKLVIVGKKGWHYKEIFTYIDSLTEKQQIVFTGYVKDECLPLIFRGASVFVYPSFYEGFGIPVLEALACGVPVITSNVSSMPEVVGGAGILIDPHNLLEIQSAMEKMLYSQDLREQYKTAGIIQSRKFSWDKCAKETLAVYKEVVYAGE